MKATLDLTKIGNHIDKFITPDGCEWLNIHVSLIKDTIKEYMNGMKVIETEKDKFQVETNNAIAFTELMEQYELETSLNGQVEFFLERLLIMLDDWLEDEPSEYDDFRKSHDIIYEYINVNKLKKVCPDKYYIVKNWIDEKIEDGY